MEAFISESRLNALGVAIVALVLLVALFGPLIAPQNPDQINLIAILQRPSVHHWFGTDDLGRDLFSRVIVGCRISIEAAVIILSLSVMFGTALGIVSGLAGGLADEIIMRVTDLFLAFPGFILAAAIAATLGPSLRTRCSRWRWSSGPGTRASFAGRCCRCGSASSSSPPGWPRAGTVWIATRHLARNVLSILIVQVSLDVGYAILATSSLSFLGLGAQPPSPEWGAIIAEGRSYIQTAWWWIHVCRDRAGPDRPGLQPARRRPPGLDRPAASGEPRRGAGVSADSQCAGRRRAMRCCASGTSPCASTAAGTSCAP